MMSPYFCNPSGGAQHRNRVLERLTTDRRALSRHMAFSASAVTQAIRRRTGDARIRNTRRCSCNTRFHATQRSFNTCPPHTCAPLLSSPRKIFADASIDALLEVRTRGSCLFASSIHSCLLPLHPRSVPSLLKPAELALRSSHFQRIVMHSWSMPVMPMPCNHVHPPDVNQSGAWRLSIIVLVPLLNLFSRPTLFPTLVMLC